MSRRRRARKHPSLSNRTENASKVFAISAAIVGCVTLAAVWTYGPFQTITPNIDPEPVARPALPTKATEPSDHSFYCTVAEVTDGDTLRCRELDSSGRQIRIRVAGIAARESDESCAPGHPCPEASGQAARQLLRSMSLSQRLSCQHRGETYGRIAAFCQRDDGLDLSCAMVASGTALRWDRHWGDHRCGSNTQ